MTRDGVQVTRQPSGVWRIETSFSGKRIGLVFAIDEHEAYRIAQVEARAVATLAREIGRSRGGAGTGAESGPPAA